MIEKINTEILGCYLLKFKSFRDERGLFAEAYNELAFSAANLPTRWPQDNISVSLKGTIRGLHVQKTNPQGKLVRCLAGSIFDACVDLRDGSPTFGKSVTAILDSPDMALYCPPGTAHGFASITDSVVSYKCTTLYDKESDGGVFFADPTIGIKWPVDPEHVSAKDWRLPRLMDYVQSRG